MFENIGITVLRQIPQEVLLGLVTGSNKLHGGVVRDMGGRIVAHLVEPGAKTALNASTLVSALPGMGWVADAYQAYQLHDMGLKLVQVQNQLGTVMRVATAATALSGLGVVVGIANLAVLSRQIKAVGDAVQRVEAQTKRTNRFLDASHYGDLQSALDNLRHAREASSPAIATNWLQSAKTQFARIFHRAQTLWPKAETVDEALALEESACVAMSGHALAMSELQEHATAAADFAMHRAQWRALAREWCQTHVLRADPQRLLQGEASAGISARDLVNLMDFTQTDAESAPRGIDWIDDLRARPVSSSWAPKMLSSRKDDGPEIAFALRLLARDEILGATHAHLNLLAQRRVSASAFEAMVQQARTEALASGDDERPLWVIPTMAAAAATQPVAA